MSKDYYFYGVLDSDTSKDVVRDARSSMESRFVLQDAQGRYVTLVTSMNWKGDFTLVVENESRSATYTLESGNAFSVLEQGEEG